MIKGLKQFAKLKAVLQTDDGGKTWFVARQDYLAHANTQYNKFEHSGINIEGQSFKLEE